MGRMLDGRAALITGSRGIGRATARASYVTGACYNVDGGWMAY